MQDVDTGKQRARVDKRPANDSGRFFVGAELELRNEMDRKSKQETMMMVFVNVKRRHLFGRQIFEVHGGIRNACHGRNFKYIPLSYESHFFSLDSLSLIDSSFWHRTFQISPRQSRTFVSII